MSNQLTHQQPISLRNVTYSIYHIYHYKKQLLELHLLRALESSKPKDF